MRVLLLLSLTLVACTPTTSQLRVRFAKEHACSEDETRVVENGGTLYTATGCGKTVEYVCPTFANGNARSCEEQGGPTPKPGTEVPPIPAATSPALAPGPVSK